MNYVNTYDYMYIENIKKDILKIIKNFIASIQRVSIQERI